MTKKIDLILKEVLARVEPPKKESEIIENSLKRFLEVVEKRIKGLKIDAEIFVGGSFARNTMIKKDYYDVDVFIRFDKKYKGEEISKLTAKILKGMKNISVIHGSRDYFRIKINPCFFIELVPVMKVRTPKESENITDLSYSHVKYINKKIKSEKLLDEIRIAKAFCYANHCYGAESYVNGFSGYGLELLVYYYKGFLKFIQAMSKENKDKIIIDIEKQYKKKQSVLIDVNSAKLNSPIILIDPTYKQRNVLAALSYETFERFKKDCKEFLKNPSIKSFEIKKTDLVEIKESARKNEQEFVLVKAETTKQEGDVAGSKLLKFYKHMDYEIGKFFEIKNKGFNYDGRKSAKYFFVVKRKNEILISGPNSDDKKNVVLFRKKHRNIFIKKKKVYAKERINFSIKMFIANWKKKNKVKIKDMTIKDLMVVG